MDRFRFNVAISKLMVLTNEIRSVLDAGGGARGAARALTQMLAPMAPFAAEELWREVLGETSSVHASSWPSYDPVLAAEATVTMVVQVNGKVRDRIEVAAGSTRPRRCRRPGRPASVTRAIGDGEVVKEIVRAPKLVNLVVA